MLSVSYKEKQLLIQSLLWINMYSQEEKEIKRKEKLNKGR